MKRPLLQLFKTAMSAHKISKQQLVVMTSDIASEATIYRMLKGTTPKHPIAAYVGINLLGLTPEVVAQAYKDQVDLDTKLKPRVVIKQVAQKSKPNEKNLLALYQQSSRQTRNAIMHLLKLDAATKAKT